MKKLLLLFISVSLFSFKASTDTIDLLVPKTMKSNKKLDLSKKNSYKIVIHDVDVKDFKGQVKVITDNDGKFFKITVPENFPKRLYPTSMFEQINKTAAYPCSICFGMPYSTAWLCWLGCTGGIDPAPPKPIISDEN
ncbi:MAG: hypothetical protein JXR05_12185 [Flavobacteriaceae bacterium]